MSKTVFYFRTTKIRALASIFGRMARFVSEVDVKVGIRELTMDIIDAEYTSLTHATVMYDDLFIVKTPGINFGVDLGALVRVMKMPGYDTLELKIVADKPGVLTVCMTGKARCSEYDLLTFIPSMPAVVTLEGMRHDDERAMAWTVSMLTSTLRDTVTSMITCKTGMFSVECMPTMNVNGAVAICGEGSFVRSRSVIDVCNNGDSKNAWALTVAMPHKQEIRKYPLAPLTQILKDSRPNDVVVIGVCRSLFVIDILVLGMGRIVQYIAPAIME